jgi:hypothetical protein
VRGEGVFYLVGVVIGWPLRSFRRWLDRQPNRAPSQISTLHKVGRLALGASVCLLILIPLAWIIWNDGPRRP